MADSMKFLVFNLGSTSTKLAIFVDGEAVCEKEISHPSELIHSFPTPRDQIDMRREAVMDFVAGSGFDFSDFTAIISRGGNACQISSGCYIINDNMLKALEYEKTPHINNSGPRLALSIAEKYGLNAYIYDAPSSDEMSDIAHLSGIPDMPRISLGHPLNQRAAAIKYAESIGRNYTDMNIIVIHLGGGCSVGMHQKGRIVDIMCDDEGGYGPDRCGGLMCHLLVDDLQRGNHTFEQMHKYWQGAGGLSGYLGTNNVVEVERRIAAGDKYAEFIYDGMVYQAAKTIGGMAAAYDGDIDAIVLTGGVARSKRWYELLEKKIRFIAPVAVVPGSYEMEALALGVARALRGEEPIHAL